MQHSLLAASVIIPTRNRADLLCQTLPRLAVQSVSSEGWELIVVDDGSAPETADEGEAIVTGLGLPHVRFLRVAHGGASRARNTAIAIARGRTLIFVDDDAFVGPHFLERHLALHAEGRVLVAGGIVQVRAIPVVVDERPTLRAYHRHPMPGGNSSVAAAEVRAVGGFDPWFSNYGWQDQELAQRLLARGLVRRFAWHAPIHHFKPPSYDRDLKSQLSREMERGRMGARFYTKHQALTVGITTKCWPPLRVALTLIARALDIDTLRDRILDGSCDGIDVAPWKAALLRSSTESEAGYDELRRLSALSAAAHRGSLSPSHDAAPPEP